MEEYTADAFANRDEPIPLLSVPYSDVDASSSEAEPTSRRKKLKKTLSPSGLRDKAQDLSAVLDEKAAGSPEARISIQDRLFAKILQQVIPDEDIDDGTTKPVDPRSSKYVRRPSFSLPVMTNNFRRFNARIGIVFVFQNRMIRLFSWRTPTHTLAFLATYSFVCLNPQLLVVVPVIMTLLYIMVPAFISRHPPPPEQAATSSTTPYYSTYTGPAIAPARTIKPASETSKDFFRNMRDLQNSMADFSNLHDLLVSNVTPVTNFSDEILSSTLFLYCTLLTCLLFISAHLLPWRFIFLIAGHAAVISSHPNVQVWLIKMQKKAEKRASQALSDAKAKTPTSLFGIPLSATPQALQSTLSTLSAITLSTTPETREVEVFELQHRPLSTALSNESAAEWRPYLFTPTPYDPLSPSRISGDRPKGTRFFEDVQPPEGWEWATKKWELDLEAGEWVNERLVVGVEYDVLRARDDLDETQTVASEDFRRDGVSGDFGGWVWDLPPAAGSRGVREEDLWLAYGDYEIPAGEESKKTKKPQKKPQPKGHSREDSLKDKDWEEVTRFGARGRTGEWRRRRWVRLVKQKPMHSSNEHA